MARGGDEHVAVSENVIRVCATSAVAIGDGIPLEQDAAAGRKSGDGFEAEECGCGEEESKWAEEKLAHVRDGIARFGLLKACDAGPLGWSEMWGFASVRFLQCSRHGPN